MTLKEWNFLFLIIIIFIAACIETDIYLPAFTDMMAYFNVSEEAIQGLLTWNFVGFCIAGPFYGPLSDAIGRKKPLIFALGLFFIGSLITLYSQSFEMMLFGRVLQGLGSGGCFTLGTAIIFDAFQQQKAIEALNRINSICPFIMALAPMVGGYLNYTFGFRSNFLAIALCVAASLLISLFFYGETLQKEKRVELDVKQILKNFKKVSLSLPFWQTTTIISLPFAGYLAFLSTISVLYILEFGMTKQELPFHQAVILGGWLIASWTFKPCLKRSSIAQIKMIGTVLMLASAISLIVAALAVPTNPYYFTAAMTVFAFGVNWSQGLYFPESMEIFPEIRGIAASLLTSIRLLMTAAIVGCSSLLYNGTIYPVVTVVVATILVTVATTIIYENKKRALEKVPLV